MLTPSSFFLTNPLRWALLGDIGQIVFYVSKAKITRKSIAVRCMQFCRGRNLSNDEMAAENIVYLRGL